MTREEKLAILKGDTAPKPPTQAEALTTLKAEDAARPESNEGWGPWLKNIDKALAQGVVKGVVSLPGLPGDMQQLSGKLPPWLKANPIVGSMSVGLDMLPQMPTSTDVLEGFEDLTGEKFKTYEGVPAYAERAGEFFTPTPGGKLKLGREAATALAGGAGSKSMEDLASVLAPENASWASLIGGLLGVAGGSKLKGPNPVKMAAENAPSPEALYQNKSNAYQAVDQYGDLDKTKFDDAMGRMADQLEKKAIHSSDEPGMAPVIETIVRKPQVSFEDVDSIAQRAGESAVQGEKHKERTLGRIVLDHINKYYDDLDTSSAPGIRERIDTAKDLGRSNLLSRGVEEARSPGYLATPGTEIGEMNQVRSYLKQKDKSLRPLEKKAAGQAVGRASRHSMARDIGRTLKSGPAQVIQALAVLGSPFTGHTAEALAAAVGSFGLGHAAEAWADLKTGKKLDELEAVFRSGKEGQAKALAKADKINKANTKTGLTTGILGSIRSQQAEEFERNRKRPKKKGLPEVNLPVVPGWSTTE